MSKEVLQKLAEHEKRFEEYKKRFVNIDKHFDRIEYELKNNVATKTDISNIMTMLDKLVDFARKKDQELVFMGARVSRIEKLVCG